MNELLFADKVRQALDDAAGLDARTLDRLRTARELALARGGERSVVLGHGSGVATHGIGHLFSWRWWGPVLLLAIGLASIHIGRQHLQTADAIETDVELLSDKLPIDAYLDKGFEAWLKKRQRNP